MYREQGNGNFSQEVWRLVSILIKDSHHQNIMNIFDRAVETKKEVRYLFVANYSIMSQFFNLF